MKKFTTLVAVAALATATAMPAVAQDADASADPFVSTAGPELGLNAGLIAAGIVILAIAIAAIDSSDGT